MVVVGSYLAMFDSFQKKNVTLVANYVISDIAFYKQAESE